MGFAGHRNVIVAHFAAQKTSFRVKNSNFADNYLTEAADLKFVDLITPLPLRLANSFGKARAFRKVLLTAPGGSTRFRCPFLGQKWRRHQSHGMEFFHKTFLERLVRGLSSFSSVKFGNRFRYELIGAAHGG